MEDNTTQTSPQQPSFMPVIGIIVVLVIIAGIGFAAMKNNPQLQKVTQTQEMAAKPTDGSVKSAATSTEKTFTINGGNYYFKPSTMTVKKGDTVKINFVNDGGFHDFVLDEFNVKTAIVGSGKTATVEFTADKTGTFEYYCGVGMHRQMGMKGTLTVE